MKAIHCSALRTKLDTQPLAPKRPRPRGVRR